MVIVSRLARTNASDDWSWIVYLDYSLAETNHHEIDLWCREHFTVAEYSYRFANVVLFRDYESAVFFQLTWG